MIRAGLLGRVGLLLAALGCGDDLPIERDAGACSPLDCAPYACGNGDFCLRSCRAPEQCAPEHVCQAGACVGTECTAETAREVCGPYACLNGNCATDCALGPCADGFYCRGNDNECVPHCTEPDDPLCEGYLCNIEVGECEPYCDQELPCAEGYQCDPDGHCQPQAARVQGQGPQANTSPPQSSAGTSPSDTMQSMVHSDTPSQLATPESMATRQAESETQATSQSSPQSTSQIETLSQVAVQTSPHPR